MKCANSKILALYFLLSLFQGNIVKADLSVYFYNDGSDFVIDYYGSVDVSGAGTYSGGGYSTNYMRVFSRDYPTLNDIFESQIGLVSSPYTLYFLPRDQPYEVTGEVTIREYNGTGIARDNIQISGYNTVGFYLNGGISSYPEHTLFFPAGYNGETIRMQARQLGGALYLPDAVTERVAIGTQSLFINSGITPVGLPNPMDFPAITNAPHGVPEISAQGSLAALASLFVLMLLIFEMRTQRREETKM